MEIENPSTEQVQNLEQIQLPNSSGVLAMGIISIVGFCCIGGLVGVTLGIIALVLGNNAIKEYSDNPEKFTEKSYKNAKSGRVCAIIGICLSGIMFIGFLIKLSVLGFAFGTLLKTMPWEMM